MLVLLSLACIDPAAGPSGSSEPSEPAAPPEILVELELEGTSLGEMLGGFGFVRTWPATGDREAIHELQVVLTTYPDPCEALTGFYEELADELEADPYASDWEQKVEEAAERFPSEPYDTVVLSFGAPGDRSALEDDYDMRWGVDLASLYVEAGRTGFGDFAFVHSVEGASAVTALDPFAGEGGASVVHDDGTEGTLDFSFEVPACTTYLPALERYEAAQPDDCRGVACG